MAFGIRILDYRNLNEAYAFLRDQQDEATIYAADEGADQTEVCIRLADGHWRNPLPPLVDRDPSDEVSPAETDAEVENDDPVEPDAEFENDLDELANDFLEANPPELRSVEAAGPDIDLPLRVSSKAATLDDKVQTRFNRSCDNRRSWKSKKVADQFARHRV